MPANLLQLIQVLEADDIDIMVLLKVRTKELYSKF